MGYPPDGFPPAADEVVEFFIERAAIIQYDGGRDRLDAEAMAAIETVARFGSGRLPRYVTFASFGSGGAVKAGEWEYRYNQQGSTRIIKRSGSDR